MSDVAYYRMFADYNRWANKRLYDAVAKLTPESYFQKRPAFFKSIHGGLNHLVVTDRIWLARLVGTSDDRPLDSILYDDFRSLRVAREAEDERLISIVNGIDAARLEGRLIYKNSKGTAFQTPMKTVLGHMFNHETHHRGQVHDLLSQTDVAPPSLDLIAYDREINP
jgi:uncharacterized damage-inducible protein DinB